ncbi:MAG TPA: hypothetical protein VJ083_01450 [Sedimentibacter sp.]|nr:hypothetical protein [Sedimentibacter sp.]
MNEQLKNTPEYKIVNDLTVLTFLLNDVQETLLLNLLQTFKDLKFKHKTEFEHKIKQSLVSVQNLKKPVNKIDLDSQCRFGDVADDLYQLIFNIYVATGGHPKNLSAINNFVLKFAIEYTEEGEKYCTCCKKAKPITQFYHNNRYTDRLSFYCKECSDYKVKLSKNKKLRKGL